MQIKFLEEPKIFHLAGKNFSYLFHIGPAGELRHIFYGGAVQDEEFLSSFARREARSSFSPHPEGLCAGDSLDILPLEYSSFGSGDFRITSSALRKMNGSCVTSLVYDSHRIFAGKNALEGLPSSFAGKEEAMTLEVTMKDGFSEAEFILSYTIFADSDVIARSVRIHNPAEEPVIIEKVMSLQLDFPHSNWDLIGLKGHWAQERQAYRCHISPGMQGFGSVRGSSGHGYNPGFVLTEPSGTEKSGETYGMLLLYSGNYLAQIESSQYDSCRAVLGIHPEGFSWHLAPGESFQAPEALLFYSPEGIGGISQISHHFLTEHVIRSPWKHRRRPVLINSWEAAYFDFDGEKIYSIAEEASKLGIEMLVLDDGWFGERNGDKTSLGDWFVNRKKLGDLNSLVKRINALGMKFGLWFEPEMISEKSHLYEAHPEWVLSVPEKRRSIGRSQLVLDMSRKEVVDHLFQTISSILHSANIEYIKWDMNRNLTEVYSSLLPPERQGEVFHRYVLGVYSLHERLLKEFPDLLIEGCSGGGGRFDAGMLYYTPQIWCSDDTDAVERISIQMGTTLFYPVASMGAHVSVCPNHMTKRSVSFAFRTAAALCGTFGYELDVTKLSPEEKELVRQGVRDYHKWNDLIREGTFYRLTDGFGIPDLAAWCWVAPDKKEVLITVLRKRGDPCGRNPEYHLRLRGLDKDALYLLEDGRRVHGSTLMNGGIWIRNIDRNASSVMLHIKTE